MKYLRRTECPPIEYPFRKNTALQKRELVILHKYYIMYLVYAIKRKRSISCGMNVGEI